MNKLFTEEKSQLFYNYVNLQENSRAFLGYHLVLIPNATKPTHVSWKDFKVNVYFLIFMFWSIKLTKHF